MVNFPLMSQHKIPLQTVILGLVLLQRCDYKNNRKRLHMSIRATLITIIGGAHQ